MVYEITHRPFFDISNYILEKHTEFKQLHLTDLDVPDAYAKNMHIVPLTDSDHVDSNTLLTVRSFISNITDQYKITNTLSVMYPPGGYIDWHTNENFSFYNAICTYSNTRNSFYEYKTEEGKVLRVDDRPGWYVKETKWSKTQPVWHRAVSGDIRITFTFSHPDHNVVDNFIKQITYGYGE